MFFNHIKDQLNASCAEAKRVVGANKDTARVLSGSNASECLGAMGSMVGLAFREKEIFVLAALQWVTICFGYLLFIQSLDWIPDDMWRAVGDAGNKGRDDVGKLVSIGLVLWSVAVIGIVSFPLSILNNAMIAVYIQTKMTGTSTLMNALVMATKNIGRVYALTAVDAWITAHAIFDRLPRKRGKRTLGDEALYYAWKVGTFAVLPALANGRGIIDAGKDNITLLKTHPLRCLGLRFGYSLLCWIIGIFAYIGAICWFGQSDITREAPNWIYSFYRWMFVPICLAVGIVTVLMRPFYLLSVTKLYMETIGIDEDHFMQPANVADAWRFMGVTLMLILMLGTVVYLAPEMLGLRSLFENLSARDLAGR